jgi:hypothetical protein
VEVVVTKLKSGSKTPQKTPHVISGGSSSTPKPKTESVFHRLVEALDKEKRISGTESETLLESNTLFKEIKDKDISLYLEDDPDYVCAKVIPRAIHYNRAGIFIYLFDKLCADKETVRSLTWVGMLYKDAVLKGCDENIVTRLTTEADNLLVRQFGRFPEKTPELSLYYVSYFQRLLKLVPDEQNKKTSIKTQLLPLLMECAGGENNTTCVLSNIVHVDSMRFLFSYLDEDDQKLLIKQRDKKEKRTVGHFLVNVSQPLLASTQKAFKYYIEQGGELVAFDSKNRSPFSLYLEHKIIRLSDLEYLTKKDEKTENLDRLYNTVSDSSGCSPLYPLIDTNNHEFVEAALKGRMSANIIHTKPKTVAESSPLLYALGGGQDEIIRVLLEGGADYKLATENIEHKPRKTPLYYVFDVLIENQTPTWFQKRSKSAHKDAIKNIIKLFLKYETPETIKELVETADSFISPAVANEKLAIDINDIVIDLIRTYPTIATALISKMPTYLLVKTGADAQGYNTVLVQQLGQVLQGLNKFEALSKKAQQQTVKALLRAFGITNYIKALVNAINGHQMSTLALSSFLLHIDEKATKKLSEQERSDLKKIILSFELTQQIELAKHFDFEKEIVANMMDKDPRSVLSALKPLPKLRTDYLQKISDEVKKTLPIDTIELLLVTNPSELSDEVRKHILLSGNDLKKPVMEKLFSTLGDTAKFDLYSALKEKNNPSKLIEYIEKIVGKVQISVQALTRDKTDLAIELTAQLPFAERGIVARLVATKNIKFDTKIKFISRFENENSYSDILNHLLTEQEVALWVKHIIEKNGNEDLLRIVYGKICCFKETEDQQYLLLKAIVQKNGLSKLSEEEKQFFLNQGYQRNDTIMLLSWFPQQIDAAYIEKNHGYAHLVAVIHSFSTQSSIIKSLPETIKQGLLQFILMNPKQKYSAEIIQWVAEQLYKILLIKFNAIAYCLNHIATQRNYCISVLSCDERRALTQEGIKAYENSISAMPFRDEIPDGLINFAHDNWNFEESFLEHRQKLKEFLYSVNTKNISQAFFERYKANLEILKQTFNLPEQTIPAKEIDEAHYHRYVHEFECQWRVISYFLSLQDDKYIPFHNLEMSSIDGHNDFSNATVREAKAVLNLLHHTQAQTYLGGSTQEELRKSKSRFLGSSDFDIQIIIAYDWNEKDILKSQQDFYNRAYIIVRNLAKFLGRNFDPKSIKTGVNSKTNLPYLNVKFGDVDLSFNAQSSELVHSGNCKVNYTDGDKFGQMSHAPTPPGKKHPTIALVEKEFYLNPDYKNDLEQRRNPDNPQFLSSITVAVLKALIRNYDTAKLNNDDFETVLQPLLNLEYKQPLVYFFSRYVENFYNLFKRDEKLRTEIIAFLKIISKDRPVCLSVLFKEAYDNQVRAERAAQVRAEQEAHQAQVYAEHVRAQEQQAYYYAEHVRAQEQQAYYAEQARAAQEQQAYYAEQARIAQEQANYEQLVRAQEQAYHERQAYLRQQPVPFYAATTQLYRSSVQPSSLRPYSPMVYSPIDEMPRSPVPQSPPNRNGSSGWN